MTLADTGLCLLIAINRVANFCHFWKCPLLSLVQHIIVCDNADALLIGLAVTKAYFTLKLRCLKQATGVTMANAISPRLVVYFSRSRTLLLKKDANWLLRESSRTLVEVGHLGRVIRLCCVTSARLVGSRVKAQDYGGSNASLSQLCGHDSLST